MSCVIGQSIQNFICLRQLGAHTQSSQPGLSRENPYHHTRCRILFAFLLIWDAGTNIQLLQIQKPGGGGGGGGGVGGESESCHVTRLLASCSWDWAGWEGMVMSGKRTHRSGRRVLCGRCRINREGRRNRQENYTSLAAARVTSTRV